MALLLALTLLNVNINRFKAWMYMYMYMYMRVVQLKSFPGGGGVRSVGALPPKHTPACLHAVCMVSIETQEYIQTIEKDTQGVKSFV